MQLTWYRPAAAFLNEKRVQFQSRFQISLHIYILKCFIFFIHSQILIEVRTWCLLSSQKCSSQFIDIRNCYIYFSESVLLNYFLPTFVVCFDSPHLRRLKKNLSTTNVEKKIQQIQIRKIEITISYGNGMSWTFLWW